MNQFDKHIELLAPAKNAETGIAAVNCGADAVYIAAKKFGAREDAGNSIADIQKLISYAHKYYTRVYVALNTILRNDEIDEALKLIDHIYGIRANGLIIQDVGLLECRLPPIPLIASTQMNNDSVEKILFLEKVGFKRAILARELTLGQIKEIRAKTSIELESFVHGSLCVSYSGQCYLSYAIGRRSANRGACAQPCRHCYSLLDENGNVLVKDKHLLSLKDLNRADHLKQLIDAGVRSFKIEGRLKDIAYVTNIVSFYRKKLDELIDNKNIFNPSTLPGLKAGACSGLILSEVECIKSSSGQTTFGFTPDPHKTFNRGFTNYCLEGIKENMASIHTPKSLGEKIGPVAKVRNDYFTLSVNHDLKNGDGICFFDHNQVLRGTMLNKVTGEKIYPDKMYYIEEKTVIYRNYDSAFVKILEKSPCRRKIGVAFTLEESEEGFKLDARDEDANTGTILLAAKKTKAEKKELAESAIKNQLSKLNETIFSCNNITINLKEMYFIPLSVLNQLRREVVENLLTQREKNRPQETGEVLVNDAPYPIKSITYLGNCLNSKAESFYQRHGAKIIELAAENGMNMSGRRVMVAKYCVRKELDLCGKDSTPLYLVDEYNLKLHLKFNCKDCIMEVYFPPEA